MGPPSIEPDVCGDAIGRAGVLARSGSTNPTVVVDSSSLQLGLSGDAGWLATMMII